MQCNCCGSTDGHWDCEYWECHECGESTCATSYGIDVYGNGKVSPDDDSKDIFEDEDEYCNEDYDEDEY